MTNEDRQPLTSTEKKRRYRAKMKAAGYKEIGCWICPTQADKLRTYARSLPKPVVETANPDQTSIFDMLPPTENHPQA